MDLVNLSSGALEPVPDDKVAQAFADKTHGFASPDQPVPVKLADGRIGTVPASQAHAAFASGATVAPHDEYQHAVNQAKYGGIGGTAIAGAEGVARGLTVGLSDPLAIGAARAFGGEKAAQATREHLAGEKEASPYVSGAGEILGAAAPIIASGGAAAPEEAAALGAGEVASAAGEAAQASGRVSSLLRAVGALPEGVTKVGEAAAKTFDAVAGQAPGAAGAMARIARAGARSGVQMGAEGALFGAGQQVSEDALGDHDLTAEKLAAAMGHGALFGMLAGGTLGTLGAAAKEAAGSVLNRIAPTMDRQADIEAYKALHPKLGLTKEAIARAGGEQEVGATVRKFGLFGDSPLEAAKMDPETLLERTSAAQDQVGKQIGDLVEANKDTRIKLSDMLEPIDKRIAEAESKVGNEGQASSLRDLRESVTRVLGGAAPEVTEATAPIRRTPEEIGAFLRDNPKAAAQMAITGKLPDEAAFHPVTEAEAKPAEATVSIQDAIKQRRALQQTAFQESKSLDPKMRVQMLREISGAWGDIEEKALNEATPNGAAGNQLRDLNKDFQRLKLIEKATNERIATQATNQRLSLTDKMFGAAHLAGAVASGHPLTALGAAGVAVGSKYVRERGNAVAAVALGRLAKLDLLARAANKVDGDLDTAIEKFATAKPSPASKIRLRHFAGGTEEPLGDRYDKAQDRAPTGQEKFGPEHVDQAVPGLATHAPKTAGALADVANRSAAYLAAQQPKMRGAPDLLGKTQRPTEAQMATYLRQERGARDPVGTITRALETGKVHQDELDAAKASSPKLVAQAQQQLLTAAVKHKNKMTFSKVQTISKLTGVPLTPSLNPKGVQYFQSTYTAPTGVPAQGGPVKGAPKRMLKGTAQQTRLSAGQVNDF